MIGVVVVVIERKRKKSEKKAGNKVGSRGLLLDVRTSVTDVRRSMIRDHSACENTYSTGAPLLRVGFGFLAGTAAAASAQRKKSHGFPRIGRPSGAFMWRTGQVQNGRPRFGVSFCTVNLSAG